MESKGGDSGGPVYRKLGKDRAIAVGLVSSGNKVDLLGFTDFTAYTYARRIEVVHDLEICTLRRQC